MSLSTHVLDTSAGAPAVGVAVVAARADGDEWVELSRGQTDVDGRIADVLSGALQAGSYRLTFDTGTWFAAKGTQAFWGDIVITFEVRQPDQHHHVPLLLSPFGYSTYRGS